MTRIELSELEIKVVEQQLREDFDPFTASEDEQAAMTSVMDKANALMEELDAYEESGDDVIKWFYDKFKEQKNI